ncbi:class I SAM-dependent methyltransferase [Streptomyces boluensis]|uniref:Methyltransferase domain-containing protein n=1 Tax=Streptomyces boluensis TaxID=1775135 RepID=A0A964XM51_9ACTN|nr:class I SAM-dependent methyltransferase [Streptomyces boluensis]NBE52806.1 methyltransferase domain-containing protein [Streptomyces boluensis]
MSVSSTYKQAWEGFWGEAPQEQGAVFWDAEPAVTVALHLALFEPHLTAAGLPFVDLGCGNGTQTRFLADRFGKVLGTDLSGAAVAHARLSDPAEQAEYRQLDAADKGETEQLHAELGDANVYMRGVLHQCEQADRQPLVDNIATLLGTRGRAMVVEPAQSAGAVLRDIAQGPAGPPPKLQPVLRHGIAPGVVADEEVPEFVAAAGLTVHASGHMPLTTTDFTADGTRIELPSNWFVIGRAG